MAKVFGINTKIRGKVGEYIYRRQSIYNVGQKAGNNGGFMSVMFRLGWWLGNFVFQYSTQSVAVRMTNPAINVSFV